MLDALQKALPYLRDLHEENIEDLDSGVFRDNDLDEAFFAVCAAISTATNVIHEKLS